MMGTFAAHLPLLKHRLDLAEGTLGLMLLTMALGAVVTMFVGGPWLDKAGSRTGLTIGAITMMLALPWMAIGPAGLTMFVLFGLFGAGNGLMDVSMNAQGSSIEANAGRSIMSSMHGFFSLGGMVAAAWTAMALSAGLPSLGILSGVLLIVLPLLALAFARLLAPAAENLETGGAMLAWPTPQAMPIALLALAAFIGEGSMFDWAAVFLREVRLAEPTNAAWGFGVFSAMMALARFTGDRLTDRFGPSTVLKVSALLAIVGYVIMLAAPYLWSSFIGLGLIGLGVANIIPILFAAAGRLKSRGSAIAAVATFGYGGALAGPAIIGFVAQATNLSVALSLAGLLLVAVAWGSRRV